MKTRSFLQIMLFGFASFPILAFSQEQPGLKQKGDQFYNQYNYSKAVVLYEQIAKNKKNDKQSVARLADSYRLMNNYDAAEKWYEQLYQSRQLKNSEVLNYAEVLRNVGKFDQAKSVLREYEQTYGTSPTVKAMIKGCDSAMIWMQTPSLIKVKNEGFLNTDRSEWGAFSFNDKVLYTAERIGKKDATYGWTGQPYLGLYEADATLRLTQSELETKFNNTEYHSGPVVFSSKGDTAYVTMTFVGEKAAKEKVKHKVSLIRRLELWYTVKKDGAWGELIPFHYNNAQQYSTGHAALSKDGNILYFVSDMPGSTGKSDIWFCIKDQTSAWSKPVNCGAEINTLEEELFPTIGKKGELYFSSNGLAGMGGLDIYKAIGQKENWSSVVNMHYPVNSMVDDFMFTASTDTTGFFSSNRKEGKGGDDIYVYTIVIPPPPPAPKPEPVIVVEEPKEGNALHVFVINKQTGLPVANATLNLMNNKGKEKVVVETDGTGLFSFALSDEPIYEVKAEKNGFLSDHKNGIKNKTIQKAGAKVVLQLDSIILNKAIKLDNIYYDSGKWNLRAKSKTELNKLIEILKENPTIKIELSSHTDSRGSDQSNLILSQKRAKSAVDYIISKGIAKSRIIAKGYGETKLLNKCTNGVKCSDKDHQVNRRTEFAILSF
ncbi:Photosystem I chlorophyll a apoprotein A2 [compost metagenome]